MERQLGDNAKFWSGLIRLKQIDPCSRAQLYTLCLAYRDMEPTIYGEQQICLDVHRQYVDINLTDEQLNDKILMELLRFPDLDVSADGPHGVDRAANYIARNTIRGVGNTRFKDYIWYQNPKQLDHPEEGAVFDGAFGILWDGHKYGLFMHPKFESYGYRMVK